MIAWFLESDTWGIYGPQKPDICLMNSSGFKYTKQSRQEVQGIFYFSFLGAFALQ